MSTPAEPERWTVLTFLPGTLTLAEAAAVLSGADLGFAPATARLQVRGDEDVEVPFDADALVAQVAGQERCRGFELRTETDAGPAASAWTTRTDTQVSLRTDGPVPAAVEPLVRHPGLVAAASGDAEDQRWQSETNPRHFELWYSGAWQDRPRTTDDRGREVLDVSGNPGRRDDLPGIRLWAAQDLWFGPGAATMLDLTQVPTLPVGEVTELGPSRWHVRLWDDGTPLEEVRRRQQALRDHLGYDAVVAREDEIWDRLVQGRPDDPSFVVEEGDLSHGGVRRYLQYFSAAGYPVPRSEADLLVVQEFDADRAKVHEERVDLTSQPHPGR